MVTVHGILQARILEWVAFPFSRGSSQPRDWTQVSCIVGGALPAESQGKPVLVLHSFLWLNNISLYGWTIFHLSVSPFIDGHLMRWFPRFSYYKSCLQRTFLFKYFWVPVLIFLEYIVAVGLLRLVIPRFSFWETAKLGWAFYPHSALGLRNNPAKEEPLPFCRWENWGSERWRGPDSQWQSWGLTPDLT